MGELETLLDQAINIPVIIKATIYNEYAIMYEHQGELDKEIDYFQKTGMNTLDKSVLDRAKTSIEHCKSKKDLF